MQSRLRPKHIKQRYLVSKVMRFKPVSFWERFFVSDEKIWTVDGYFNPQNDRVRAKKKADVEAVERDKFPGKRMVWLGHSALGTSPLVHFNGKLIHELPAKMNEIYRQNGKKIPSNFDPPAISFRMPVFGLQILM